MKLKKVLGMVAVLTAFVTLAACGQKSEKDSWPDIQKKKEVTLYIQKSKYKRLQTIATPIHLNYTKYQKEKKAVQLTHILH